MDELRNNVCELATSALGGQEGEVNGRVAEAVWHIESETGLRRLSDVLPPSQGGKPWYKKWWMLGAWFLLLLIGVWFAQSVTYDRKAASSSLHTNKLVGLFAGIRLKGDGFGMSDEDKWLLNGDSSQTTKVQSMYALWESEPSNKQFAAEAVFEYQREYDVFPDDLLEIGGLVDPDNPWYQYMAAIDLVDLAVSRTKKDEKNDEGIMERNYEILDQDKLQQALALLEKADSMGSLKDHRLDLLEKRLEVYSTHRDHDFFSKIAFMAEASGYSIGGMGYLKLDHIFGVKFHELSVRGDTEEVKKWQGIYKRFIHSLIADRGTMIDVLVARALLTRYTISAQRAAERVGLDEELAKMKKLNKLLKEDKVNMKALRKQTLPLERGEYGVLGGELMNGQRSLKPLEFDPEDHLPDRYSMHSFLTKHIAVVASVLMFMLLILAACYLIFKGKLARLFGERVLSVLTVRDWVMIILGGVILPIVLYYVVNQHTSLGVRKWNVLAAGGVSIMVQFESMFMLVITASYCLLRCRLSVKSCGLVNKTDWWAWSAMASSLGAMLLIGCNGYEVSWITSTAFGFLVYPVGFLLVRGTRGLISNERLIGVAAVNKGMIALLLLATISMALLAPFYYADEKKWIREDTLITLNPQHLGEDSRSYRTMLAMKEELKERLEMIR